MVTSKVLKEVWIEDNDRFFTDFSPVGKYSFLFDRFIFRGEKTEKFTKLLPTSLREDPSSIMSLYNYAQLPMNDQYKFEFQYQSAELSVLREFYKAANNKGLNLPNIDFFRNHSLEPHIFIDTARNEIGDKWLPDSFLELAALAQHYGLPTRLIDWSKDIYTALYFSSSDSLYSDDDSKYLVLYALDYFAIEFLKRTTKRIPLRLIVSEHYKNPNLNYQKGILSAWEYKTCYIQDLSGLRSMPLVNHKSLDILMQEYVDEHNISWGAKEAKEQEPLIYKFYIPINMSTRIYDYLLKLGYGADRLFNGFEGIPKRLKDNMACYYKKSKPTVLK